MTEDEMYDILLQINREWRQGRLSAVEYEAELTAIVRVYSNLEAA